MRPMEALDIPAKATVDLKPGGMHVMIVDVREPLVEGGIIPLDLRFERSGNKRVDAVIRSGAADHHGMAM